MSLDKHFYEGIGVRVIYECTCRFLQFVSDIETLKNYDKWKNLSVYTPVMDIEKVHSHNLTFLFTYLLNETVSEL